MLARNILKEFPPKIDEFFRVNGRLPNCILLGKAEWELFDLAILNTFSCNATSNVIFQGVRILPIDVPNLFTAAQLCVLPPIISPEAPSLSGCPLLKSSSAME